MGTTLTSLNADPGIEMAFVVAIEGYPNLIASCSAASALTAWAGTDYTACLGGLSVRWDQGAKIDPWKPFSDPAMLSFSVVPAVDSSGALVDTFGVAVAKRTPQSETRLVTAIDCNDTSIVVLRADDFAASGDVYMGPETIGYSSRDTGTDTFTVAARGKYCPVTTKANGAFAHTHKSIPLSTTTGEPLGVRTQPVVASSPITWVGRWVEVWIHRVSGGVLDVTAQAHRAFVGTIADVAEGDRGETVVSLEGVQRRIYETVLHRDPWRAQAKEGTFLDTGWKFKAYNFKQAAGTTTTAYATDLTVVAGAPASVNEITRGVYSVTEIADKINRWLAAEKTATRLIYNCRYSAIVPDAASGGSRASFQFNDPTTTANQIRSVRLTLPNLGVARFLGWSATKIEITENVASGSTTSPDVPLRISFGSVSTAQSELFRSMYFTNPQGTWITQQSLLPPALVDQNTLVDGVVRFGEFGYVRISSQQFAAGYFDWTPNAMRGYATDAALDGVKITVDEDVSLEFQQVLIFEATFANLLLYFLLSTGTPTFNHATYDSLGEAASCCIPYSVLGDGFVTEITNLAGSDRSLCAIIDKPTRFVDLFESDFLIRACFFYWGAGRLGIRGWSTPVTSQATITLDETNKAVPASSADGDLQRTTKQEDDGSIYNLVTFKYGRRSDGSYADDYTIQDATSIRDHGPRIRTVEMRNASGPATGPTAVDLRALLVGFSQSMSLFSRPFWRIKRTMARTLFEQALPGVIGSLTDKYLRDPSTGLRYSHKTSSGGVSAYAVLVIGHDYDWGGPGADAGGEVELMLIPRTSTGVYCPAALVDETQANAGYNAATGALTVYAHAYTESTDAVDAAQFAATWGIRITQIDPDVAGSALSWDRTISTVVGNVITPTATLSAPAWDATFKYRITFINYTSAQAAQKSNAFQADDADGLVADSRQAYQMIRTSGGQSASYTNSVATEAPARYATNQIGDGVALDVGGEFDIVRLANNLIHYKTAPQCPRVYSELRAARVPTGTWELLEFFPVFVGMGTLQVWQERKLYVAPYFRSTTGATASLRVTLSRMVPSGTTRSDVTFVGPVRQTTFTTTSTTFSIPSAVGLSVKHLALSGDIDGWGGVGFISIEVSSVCESAGLARRYMGPVE